MTSSLKRLRLRKSYLTELRIQQSNKLNTAKVSLVVANKNLENAQREFMTARDILNIELRKYYRALADFSVKDIATGEIIEEKRQEASELRQSATRALDYSQGILKDIARAYNNGDQDRVALLIESAHESLDKMFDFNDQAQKSRNAIHQVQEQINSEELLLAEKAVRSAKDELVIKRSKYQQAQLNIDLAKEKYDESYYLYHKFSDELKSVKIMIEFEKARISQ